MYDEDPIDDLSDRLAWCFQSRKFRGVADEAVLRFLVTRYAVKAGGDVIKGARQLRKALRQHEKVMGEALSHILH